MIISVLLWFEDRQHVGPKEGHSFTAPSAAMALLSASPRPAVQRNLRHGVAADSTAHALMSHFWFPLNQIRLGSSTDCICATLGTAASTIGLSL
jgi:hypothetical protein